MSRARHMKKASGGAAENPPVKTAYTGATSNVMKEAMEKKHGGGVKHLKGEGEKSKHRADKYRRGGRAMGGRTGADKHPLSSAATVKHISGEV